MMKRKSEAFINRDDQLRNKQDHSKFGYAGSNRNKTKWRHRDHRGPSLSNYRSTKQTKQPRLV